MPVPPLAFRAVFISDVHLGSAGSQVGRLRTFLRSFQCEQLYLVGDMVDMWVSFKKGKWQQSHTDAIRDVLGKAQRGCEVFYTPGNHDSFLRKIMPAHLGNITIDDDFVHTTATGKKLFVVHGDRWDKAMRFNWLAYAGTWLYESAITFNAWVNMRRDKKGRIPISFSTALKKRLKKSVSSKTGYAERLAFQASLADCDGVVCGHIHRPGIQEFDDGTTYVNCGDWVENCTAVVEHFDGTMELLGWKDIERMIEEAPTLDIELGKPA